MAKIVQSLTRASKEYDQGTFQSLVRDLDKRRIINKLNSTFQDEIKQEIEAKAFFLE
jgi:flagellin-specific chaperone FliS